MAAVGPVTAVELTELAIRAAKLGAVGRERAIAWIAHRQHGVVTTDQLRAVGLSGEATRRRFASARLRRLHRGVYALPGFPLVADAHRMAAVLACGRGTVISHASAAALWGIRASAAACIDVSVPGRAGRTRTGIRVHSGARLAASDLSVRHGIPCTTPARTLVDLGGVVSLPSLEYALHQAQAQRLVRRAELVAVLTRRPRLRGAAAVRKALSLGVEGDDEARSGNERTFLRICAAAGLPTPQVNHWIDMADGPGIEVDFAWPDLHLAVEVDSRRYHGTDRAFVNDRSRDRRLVAAGWRVLRFTEPDLGRPADVSAELRGVVAAAMRAVSRSR